MVEKEEEDEEQLELGPAQHRAIAPVTVPKWLPEVPVLTVTRNPLFPRFVKMLEVKKSIMKAIIIILLVCVDNRQGIKGAHS